MKRPKQLPAVDRNSQKCAFVPVGAKVGPCQSYLDDLLPYLRRIAPYVTQL